MTYLQLMTKCLSFFQKQKEEFDKYDFYFHWLGNDEDSVDSYYKNRAKKALLYLILSEIPKSGITDDSLLKLLENELSYFDVGLCQIIEKVEEKTTGLITEDPYIFEQICSSEQSGLTDDEKNEIIQELFASTNKLSPTNFELEKYESAIHNVMEMVSQIIPELYFTEKGYKYIDQELQIEDVQLRESCYEYIKSNIDYYNCNRIYRVDENVYSQFYESEEELDEFDEFDDGIEDEENLEHEDIYMDDDSLRGQVNIYGEDIDNYDILYYSATLLVVMLRFIKNKQYDKIKRMIEIDDAITNFYGFSSYEDKTLIESLYQPKAMGQDYHREISTSAKSDTCLEFFLSDNAFTQQYDTQQMALIISHCFDLLDPAPIKKVITNNSRINDVFTTTDLDNERETIKRLVKIKKGNK